MVFGRNINLKFSSFLQNAHSDCLIFPLLRRYCQLNRPMSAGEKTGSNFRANDHVLNFCKYRQNSK